MPQTLTIAEAAALTGLSKTAVRRRVERGSLPAVLRAGVRRIPLSELERQGLVPAGVGVAEAAGPPTQEAWSELLDRLVDQERRLAEYRLLAAQAESLHGEIEAERGARQAAEAALHEARARVRMLEARTSARPPGAGRALRAAAALLARAARARRLP
jgi:excisionase family DNA binding protein